MPSIESKIIRFFLGIFNFKWFVEKALKKPPRTNIKLSDTPEFQKLNTCEFLVCGKSVITITPNLCNNKLHILFFHGGAYVFEGSAMHRKLVVTFANKVSCKVSYIDYPLAPESTYIQTFEMVQKSYNLLVDKYPNDSFVFIGDSAGGGLALAFAQKLASENAIIQPQKLILFSPWLDLKMDNPQISSYITRDKILTLNGLKFTACSYAGGDNLRNYLLSPMFGNFDKLCSTLVFYGTEELLCPNIELMKIKTQLLPQFVFRKFNSMQHDWVILPIPEADHAINEAVDFIFLNLISFEKMYKTSLY